jgi:hypothetical protein
MTPVGAFGTDENTNTSANIAVAFSPVGEDRVGSCTGDPA